MYEHALLPRYPVPALKVPLTNGGRFVRGAAPGGRFDPVVFHRGQHCPIRARYLNYPARGACTGEV